MKHTCATFESPIEILVESEPLATHLGEAKQMNKVGGKFPTKETASISDDRGCAKLRFMVIMQPAVNDSLDLQGYSVTTGQSADPTERTVNGRVGKNIEVDKGSLMSREINRSVDGRRVCPSTSLRGTQVAGAYIPSPMGFLRQLVLPVQSAGERNTAKLTPIFFSAERKK